MDKVIFASSQHIQELEKNLKSVNEKLKIEKQNFVSVQEVGFAQVVYRCFLYLPLSLGTCKCNNRKEKCNIKHCQPK